MSRWEMKKIFLKPVRSAIYPANSPLRVPATMKNDTISPTLGRGWPVSAR